MNEQPLLARFLLWKRFSSFTYLNITQLLITLNDCIFRLLVAFSLINKLGTERSSTVLFITGVVFVIPFLLFSMPAGELADKCSKQKIIVWTLVAEVAGMAYGIFAMYFESTTNAFIALFVVALQASIFNPSKYAILPEIVKKEYISKVNGIMTLSTYLALILGTFLVSFFTHITGSNYTLVAIFCFCIAIIALFMSLQIEKTPVKNPTKKINPLFLYVVYKSLKRASHYPHLLLTVLASSYFVFTASYTQLNLIPFAIQSLGITDVQAGYVFLAAALGIGIGSAIVAMVSGKNVELGIALIGAFGTSISYIILYLVSHNILVTVLMILSLGIHGGLYIVPLDSYMQIASPDEDRGEIVAAGSFLGFVGVLIASLCIGFFSDILKLSAAEGYLIVGLLSLAVSVVITFLLPDYFIRFVAISFFKAFYSISSKNQPELGFYDNSLIISEKYTFSHALTLLQLYHRISFIRLVKKEPPLFLKPIYNLLHITPYPINLSSEETKKWLEKIHHKKMPLCLFLESNLNSGAAHKKNEAIKQILDLNSESTIPLVVKKSQQQSGSNAIFNLLKFLPVHVYATFGSKVDKNLDYAETTKLLEDLRQSE